MLSCLQYKLRPPLGARLRYVLMMQAKNRLLSLSLRRFRRVHLPMLPVERSLQNGIAVVIPCYNHAGYLESTFTCLAQQTYRPFEVVFVEDHSTDETWARLQQLCPQLPSGIKPILLRTPRNSGQAFAINVGVSTSKTSVIMVLNDDDYLMHDALEAVVEILGYNADLFLLGATAIPFTGYGCPPGDDESKLIRSVYPNYTLVPLTRYTPADVLRFAHPNDTNMTHSGSTFFKTAWQAVGGYYPDKSRRVVIWSDRDFQLRIASLFPIAVATEIPFAYWRSGSSVDHGKDS